MSSITLKVFRGNILSVDHGILVQGCNCQGVMGSGMAKHIKEKYPSVAQRYVERHRAQGLLLGDVQFVWNPLLLGDYPDIGGALLRRQDHSTELPRSLIVANAMTQEFYGRDPNVVYVDYNAVFAAFARVRILAEATGLPVVFPLIGAGLANGDWKTIEAAIRSGLRGQLSTAQLWIRHEDQVPEGLSS